MKNNRRLILLGPQPNYGTLRTAVGRLGKNIGRAALITAGWQKDEQLDSRALAVLPPNSVNLQLFQRSESLFKDDADLIRTLRKRQDELRLVRDGYRLRLDRSLESIWQLSELNSRTNTDLQPDFQFALDQLKQLDRQYLMRTRQIIDFYDQETDVANRPTVQRHCDDLRAILDKCEFLVVSGGHVAIILNRLKMFRVLEFCPDLPIIAWSAGAMALADQIVLFHDRPPHGKGNAEVLREGMHLFEEFLPLPDARHRLDIANESRVSLFASRFEPFACAELSEQSLLDRVNGDWECGNASKLTSKGVIEELVA